jgi:hypothetical protein
MHLALFSIPVWCVQPTSALLISRDLPLTSPDLPRWVQPIADNITTMIFNIYQSFLSHQSLDSLKSATGSSNNNYAGDTAHGSAAEPEAPEANSPW